MKHSKKKKSLLAVAPNVAALGAMALLNGRQIEGGILLLMSSAMFVVYDQLDDKAKGELELPAGIDKETFRETASLLASKARQSDIVSENSKK